MTDKEQEALRLLVEVYKEIHESHEIMVNVSIIGITKGSIIPAPLQDTMGRLERAKDLSGRLIFVILRLDDSFMESVYEALESDLDIDETVQKLISISKK